MTEVLTKNNKLLVFVGIYIFFRPIVFFIMSNFLYLMLGWNLILATIPLILSGLFLVNYKSNKKVLLIIIFLVWLFFFPNAPYLITDFIHIQNFMFYLNSPTNSLDYLRNIKEFIGLIDIVIAFIIGMLLALKSLYQFHIFFIEKLKNVYANIILVGIIILTSIGIYIGRFLRFNTWDIFRPFTLLKNVIQSFDLFAFQFIILFTFAIILVYSIYYNNKGNEDKKYILEKIKTT